MPLCAIFRIDPAQLLSAPSPRSLLLAAHLFLVLPSSHGASGPLGPLIGYTTLSVAILNLTFFSSVTDNAGTIAGATTAACPIDLTVAYGDPTVVPTAATPLEGVCGAGALAGVCNTELDALSSPLPTPSSSPKSLVPGPPAATPIRFIAPQNPPAAAAGTFLNASPTPATRGDEEGGYTRRDWNGSRMSRRNENRVGAVRGGLRIDLGAGVGGRRLKIREGGPGGSEDGRGAEGGGAGGGAEEVEGDGSVGAWTAMGGGSAGAGGSGGGREEEEEARGKLAMLQRRGDPRPGTGGERLRLERGGE